MINNISIDMGSSSVKMNLNSFDGTKLIVSEISRFDTKKIVKNNFICWDYKNIFKNIIAGLKTLSKKGIKVESIAIDGWGVDYALIDETNQIIGDVITYRDSSNVKLWDAFKESNDIFELYKINGVVHDAISTFSQLNRDLQIRKRQIAKTKKIVLIPDLLIFLLTGIINNESTITSSTGMLSKNQDNFDNYISNILKLDFLKGKKINSKISSIGKIKTKFLSDLKIGNPDVISIASHDTASAISTLDLKTKDIFLILGSWSLIGSIIDKPLISNKSFEYGFTNERAAFNKIRLLKNINGLFLMQQLKNDWNKRNRSSIGFLEITKAAKEHVAFKSFIDPTKKDFMNENDIILKIDEACINSKQDKPNNLGEYAMTIYNSLILMYKNSILQLEELLNKKIENIHVCGGGLKDEFFISLITKRLKKNIIKGNIEASSIGNSLLQLLAMKHITKKEIFEISKKVERK